MGNVSDVLSYCLSHGDEAEWFDFKENWCDWHGIGEYISALSNAAVMVGEPYGYLIWGINDETHELTNTTINFRDNSITVTIPFNRLDLSETLRNTPHDRDVTPHDTPHDGGITPHDTPHEGDTTPHDNSQDKYEGLGNTAIKILEYCNTPRNRQEILDYLGLNDRKSLMEHINKLINQGRLAMTVPEKPRSKNQKYVIIK